MRRSLRTRIAALPGSGVLHLLLGILLSFCIVASGWNQWDYTVQWSEDPTKVLTAQLQWHSIWDLPKYRGDANPPRPRRGHSLHLIKTDERSEYGGHTYVVMFGGRDNDQKAIHIPRTYDVESVRDHAPLCLRLSHIALISISYVLHF